MSKQGAKPACLPPPAADIPGTTAETIDIVDLKTEHASEVQELLAKHDVEVLGRSQGFDGNGASTACAGP